MLRAVTITHQHHPLAAPRRFKGSAPPRPYPPTKPYLLDLHQVGSYKSKFLSKSNTNTPYVLDMQDTGTTGTTLPPCQRSETLIGPDHVHGASSPNFPEGLIELDRTGSTGSDRPCMPPHERWCALGFDDSICATHIYTRDTRAAAVSSGLASGTNINVSTGCWAGVRCRQSDRNCNVEAEKAVFGVKV